MTFKKSINECIIADSSFLWSYYGRWRVHCPIQVSSVQASGEDDQMRVCDEFNEYFDKIRKMGQTEVLIGTDEVLSIPEIKKDMSYSLLRSRI